MKLELPQIQELSNEQSSVIKQIRASFESKLPSHTTRIEDWLDTVSGNERFALLAELLDAEIQYLQQNNRLPVLEEYAARFPDDLHVVRAVFVHHALASSVEEDDALTALSTKIMTPAADPPGQTDWRCDDFVGRYHLIEPIGVGGFGEVWKGFDPQLHRHVAVKLPKKRSGVRGNVASAMQEEARRAASLQDPGIVPVYDTGSTDDGAFIVSELIQGPTLAQRMKMSRLTIEDSVRIVIHLATTLHHAHMAGLVHRDIKPSNILLRPDGTPAITDFGLAMSESEQLDARAHVAGTLMYMSPEQARGESRHLDGRSDLYSLGVILFQLLTGRHPFQYRNSSELLDQILHREVRPLRSVDDKIPAELERICLKCLSKDIRLRYPTGADLAADLQKYLTLQNRRAIPAVAWKVLTAVTLALILTLLFGLKQRKNNQEISGILSGTGSQVPIALKVGQWINMLDQPVEQITTIEGDSLDFVKHDSAERLLTLRSERNPWLIATPIQSATPVRIRGTLSMDDWIGNVGFFWGLDDSTDGSRRKPLTCYALIIERFQPADSLKLSLQQFTVEETINRITYIRHSSELAFTETTVPNRPDAALEIRVVDGRVEVQFDGTPVWTAVSRDPVAEAGMKQSRGLVGFIGRGKIVVFRDTAVMFENSR